jgi:hypothetical protein
VNATRTRTSRLADLRPGEVILIDRAGHRALVLRNVPSAKPGYYDTDFQMKDGEDGGWTGRGDREIQVVMSAGAVA